MVGSPRAPVSSVIPKVTFAAARPQNASAAHAQQATNRVFFTGGPFLPRPRKVATLTGVVHRSLRLSFGADGPSPQTQGLQDCVQQSGGAEADGIVRRQAGFLLCFGHRGASLGLAERAGVERDASDPCRPGGKRRALVQVDEFI